MSTDDLIIGLYIRVDSTMGCVPKHPQAELYPSELVTLGLLYALKGDGPRRFYRWLANNYRAWFPRLPERTRLFRLLATHADWTEYFLAQPTLLGVADTYGIELRHPWPRGSRRPADRAQRALQPSLDRRRQAGVRGQPVWLDRRLGLR